MKNISALKITYKKKQRINIKCILIRMILKCLITLVKVIAYKMVSISNFFQKNQKRTNFNNQLLSSIDFSNRRKKSKENMVRFTIKERIN